MQSNGLCVEQDSVINEMKITDIYDNETLVSGLQSGWGFSCLINKEGIPDILFDTGANSSILLHNMEHLGIDMGNIGVIFIYHGHMDHAGGLQAIMQLNKHAIIYIPASLSEHLPGPMFVPVKEHIPICDSVYSTGELDGIEHSLVLGSGKALTVITGCSHPGLNEITEAASRYGTVKYVIGGFHGFRELHPLSDLSLVCPCHCTSHKLEIERLFPEKYSQCGAGSVIEL